MPLQKFQTLNFKFKIGLKGFTLIELMVAISIVAILATIGMMTYSSVQATARDAKRKANIEDIKKAMYTYQATAGNFCLGMNTCSNAIWVNYPSYTGDPAVAVSKLKPYLKDQNSMVPTGTTAGMGVFIVGPDDFWILTKLESGNPVCSAPAGVIAPFGATNVNYCIFNK